MIENYKVYLKFLDEKLAKFFEKQKPYIFCKKGCGKCCKNAQFPYSQIEVVYLLSGIKNLSDETVEQIMTNIKNVKLAKKEFKGETFSYDCPFLINNECSVYEYRGIVCRSFGLMNYGENRKVRIPFCCFQGYNYSNVMDENTQEVSSKKFKELGIEEEPLAFNTGYKFLTDEDFARGFHFQFGEVKPLIEWL